ncbi:MAG: hypothetical protein UZ19_OD1000877 [Parcubacteria bacterium OLB19]|nr:MAG: hypothetical protein UZ19_OD1000877 [Parcubacteria bacterium OLB19]
MKKIIIGVLLLLSILLSGCVGVPYIEGGYNYRVGYGAAPYGGGAYVRPDYGHRAYPGMYNRGNRGGGTIRTLPCGGYTRCW